MSVISNIHTATIYIPKTSRALTGQRLVKIVAKADKSGNYGQYLQQTMCISVPTISGAELSTFLESSNALDSHIIAFLEDVQKSLITDKIKSGAGHSITSEELTIQSLVNYLDSQGDSDKWDSNRIAQWFTDNIAESLGIMLIEKGHEDALEKLLSNAQKMFADSLGSKSKIPTAYMEKINTMLTHASDKESAIYKRFYNRVNPEKNVELDLEASLGF
jgi:hypothetical protein